MNNFRGISVVPPENLINRKIHRPQLHRRDRFFWVILSQLWENWREVLIIVKPETVIKWRRQGFRLYWRWKSKAPVGRSLYCFIILLHDRRKVVHFDVTAHPTAEWTVQQLIEAFPEDAAPRYLLRDRDQIYGAEFRLRVKKQAGEFDDVKNDF